VDEPLRLRNRARRRRRRTHTAGPTASGPGRAPFSERSGAGGRLSAVDLLRPVRAFDGFQRKHPPLALPIAVVRKFSNDQAGPLAAIIAYYSFFSIFPLLLAFVTILGFVLQGDPGARESVRNSFLGNFPIVGHQLQHEELSGSVPAVVIGVVVSIWAGHGVMGAAQNAFNRVWAIPMRERPDFLMSRLRSLAALVVLGTLFLVSSAASGLVAGGLGGVGEKVAGIALSLLLNFALFAAALRMLTVRQVPTRCLRVGALVGGVLWEILQAGGGVYVQHVLHNANSAYGSFALVLGLLAWFHLGAQATLYAAELNVVLVRRLWPRSLLGPPVLPADREALAALARVEERSDEEQVDVRFRE
jgi:membrane protein